MSYSLFGVGFMIEKDICRSPISTKGSVNWQIKIFNWTEIPENFVEMILVDVLGQPLYNNLCASDWRLLARLPAGTSTSASAPATTIAPMAAVAPRRGCWRP
jgi:hypothetical protein